QTIQPLRDGVARSRSLSLRAIPQRNVEGPAVLASGPGQRAKDHVGHWMVTVEANPQDLARDTLKRGIANGAVPPLHQDRFKVERPSRRSHHRSRAVSINLQS